MLDVLISGKNLDSSVNLRLEYRVPAILVTVKKSPDCPLTPVRQAQWALIPPWVPRLRPSKSNLKFAGYQNKFHWQNSAWPLCQVQGPEALGPGEILNSHWPGRL